MMQKIRTFVAVEAAFFALAALIHFGVLMTGFAHRKAGTAESVIATVLAAGLIATFVRPASTRAVGFGVQAFALLGTLVGIFTIAIGVGPQTLPDLLYHVVIVGVLAAGLVTSAPARVRR